MTRTVFIQERIPRGLLQDDLLEELGWEILDYFKDLEIPEVDLDLENEWVKVTLSGPDEGVGENLLIRIYGKLPSIGKVKVGDTFKGFITDLGKIGYGTYFKAFLENKDALYPLYEMRHQLARGKKVSARKISQIYGLIDGLALEIRVFKRDEKGVYVSLSPRQLATIMSWVKRKLDVLFVVGATPKHVNRALLRTGHKRDVSIVRTSFLSHALVCKRGTQARGLIPRIGPHLPGAILSAFSPYKVVELIEG